MKKLTFILILLFVATNSPAQTIKFVCRVDSVISQGRDETTFTVIREDNCLKETLVYKWERFVPRPGNIKRGTWLTVSYKPGDCVDNVVMAKIKFGK